MAWLGLLVLAVGVFHRLAAAGVGGGVWVVKVAGCCRRPVAGCCVGVVCVAGWSVSGDAVRGVVRATSGQVRELAGVVGVVGDDVLPAVVEAGGVSGVVARALDGWVGDQLSGVVGPALGECGDACVAAVEVLAAVEGGDAVMVERLGAEQSRVFGSEVSVWSAGRRLGVRDAGVTPQ